MCVYITSMYLCCCKHVISYNVSYYVPINISPIHFLMSDLDLTNEKKKKCIKIKSSKTVYEDNEHACTARNV